MGLAARLAVALFCVAILAACLGGAPSQAAKKQATASAVSTPPSASSPEPTLPSVTPGAVAGPSACAGQLVTDAAGLKQALAAAIPGTVIALAPGIYPGRFVASVSGTASEPITLCGGRDAIIDGGAIKSGYAFHVSGASWWNLVGFAVRGGQKGVVTDHASHVLISGLYVHDVGDEAIHLRAMSTDNTVEGVTVRNTGLHNAKFGEGIYVGSANSNWCLYTACGPDTSDRNVIRNCDISQTTAENIDIKEGTTGGMVVGNRLSGEGMIASAATAWLNAKGNQWTITDNAGRLSLKDGFQVHQVAAGWGVANIFRGNHAEVDGPGYGFYVQRVSLATTLGCDNTAVGAALGLSNTRCTT